MAAQDVHTTYLKNLDARIKANMHGQRDSARYYNEVQKAYAQQHGLKEQYALCVLKNWEFAYYDKDFEEMNRVQTVSKSVLDSLQIPMDSPPYSDYYFISANNASKQGDFRKSNELYNSALKVALNLEATTKENIATFYNNIGANYRYLGENEKAIDFYIESLRHQPNDPITLNNIGRAKLGLEKKKAALVDFESAFEILNKQKKPIPWKLKTVFNNLINTHSHLKQFDKAEKLLVKYQKFVQAHPKFEFAYLRSRANFFKKSGNFEKASEAYNHITSLYENGLSVKESYKVSDYIELAESLSELKKYDAALVSSNKAIALQKYDKDKEGYDLAAYTLKAFTQKCAILKKLDRTKEAIETYDLAMGLMTKMRNGKVNVKSQKQVIAEAYPLFEGAIDFAFRTERFEECFNYSEKLKSVLLEQEQRDSEAKDFASVPDSILKQEKSLLQMLQYYEEKAHSSKNDSLRKNFSALAFQYGNEYEALKAKMQGDYPDYYNYKYQDRSVSITEIQSHLATNELYLSYFFGEELVYLFSIAKNGFKVHLLGKSEEIEDQLTQLGKAVQNPGDFHALSIGHKVYQSVLEPALVNQTGIERLVVVPDGPLHFVSFDCFLTASSPGTNQLSTWPFLLKSFVTSYAASANLFVEQFQESNDLAQAQKMFGGFAGYYGDTPLADRKNERGSLALRSDHLAPLPGAIKEVQEIGALLDGDVWIDTPEPEKRFKERAADYGIIHMSMHGVLDPENGDYSYMAFTNKADDSEDNLLKAAEIYTLKLNAQLAVLSACSTGDGELSKGEGVMSLSRAFSYAKCPSIVMSKWQAADFSTKDIMIGFYESLIQGSRKDQALRQAKLDYIKLADEKYLDFNLAHPFYWAAFVPSGNMEPIAGLKTSSWSFIWLLLIGAICIALGVLINARRGKA